MVLIFIVIGIIMFVYGVLRVTGIKMRDISKDSEFDKKFLSEKNRYFITRYWAGSMLMIAGFGAMALGLILYFSK